MVEKMLEKTWEKMSEKKIFRGDNWLKKASLIMAVMALLIIFSNPIYSSFVSSPEINPGIATIYTDQDLTCKWTVNQTLTVTVNWYRNNVLNTTYSRSCTADVACATEGAGIVSQNFTTKNEVWICEVIHDTGSGNESQNETITIQDSTPTFPLIYYSNGTLIENSTVPIAPEDSVTTFQLNSTDADGDSIIYVLEANTAGCTVNSGSGLITCNPTSESHVGLKTLQYYSRTTNYATKGTVDKTINVTPNNDAPYFSPALQNKQVLEYNSLNYTISGADDESNTPYNFSIITNLTSLIIEYVSATSAIIKFNNSGMDIASFNDRGNHTVYVNITDSGDPSRSTISSFVLEVVPQNHLTNISYLVYNSGSLIQGGTLYIEINASDVDNDTLTFYSSNTQLYNITYTATDKTDPEGVSTASGNISVTLLTNNHVVTNSFNIIIFDGKENKTQPISLTITNINDAPVIYNYSYNDTNTLDNVDIDNLTAYEGVMFSYKVNATDIDMLTYESDTLTYTTNDSGNFPIDSSTGVISFNPSVVGAFLFIVTVTDSYGSTFNKTANLTIYPNQNPYFTVDPIIINCYEYDINNYAANCTYNMSSNVSEDDAGDYIDTYWTNSTLFNITDEGYISFRPDQSIVGNHTFLFNITDSRGGMNSTIITMIINNTNDVPVINDTVSIPPGRMMVGNAYQITVFASDEDLSLQDTYENLTFNYTVTGPNITLFTLEKNDIVEAVINFNPLTNIDAGNYTINITVSDYYGNISNVKSLNFFIYNVTYAPNITQISPFGSPLINDSVNTSWMNTSYFSGSRTNITIYENSTYTFYQNTTLDQSYANTASYNWTYNGSSISSNSNVSRSYNFFSNSTYTLNVTVSDSFGKMATFAWYIKVLNLNRPPQILNALSNLTGITAVNGTTTYNGYMTYYGSTARFYDPDDDTNIDGRVDDDELRMTFTATNCSYATFSFIGTALKVTTVEVGECYVNFTATDADNGSEYVIASDVLINVTYVSNETVVDPTPRPTGGGGGGSSTITITIPLPEEVDRPKPLEIIAPKLVTIYKNATLKVPIILNNTWNDTLEGITLRVYTNATNVTTYLDKVYFPRLYTDEVQEITLIIENYKSEGHYEIQIYANVTNPDFKDTATIFVNSADTRSEGEELETLIGFAQDLLSANPECQELTELLNEAKKELSNSNFLATSRLVDSVISGCKYLIENSRNIEHPAADFNKTFEWRTKYSDYLLIGAFAILFIIAVFYLLKKDDTDF